LALIPFFIHFVYIFPNPSLGFNPFLIFFSGYALHLALNLSGNKSPLCTPLLPIKTTSGYDAMHMG
jgi:hypothetical protein